MISIAAPTVGTKEYERIADVIDSGMLADGPTVRAFEEAFATFCETEFGVGTSNGTTALHAALKALGIGPGNRVLTTPFSFVASANAIRLAGAEPVFADIRPDTYTIDPAAVERQIRKHEEDIDAILAVHLYGLPADIHELSRIADRYDAVLIEDAAQAHGAEVGGALVGSLGDVGCFSFYPTKNMTTGEGGMLVTDDEQIAERARRFINHGRADDGTHADVGHNFRMTSIAGAIGLKQLEKLPELNRRRRENAAVLDDGLQDTALQTPVEPSGRRHVYHQYTVRTEYRSGLMSALEDHGIGYGIYYPRPIHEERAYADVEVSAPVAERAAKEVLSLPVHPSLTEDDLGRIVEVVQNA